MGAVYVADGNAGQVYKIIGQAPTPLSIGGTFSFPSGIAVDGQGNVIVADASANVVQKITPNGGYYLNHPLPKGLHMADTTGIISGTPLAGAAATSYEITGYNGDGGYSALVNITVTVPPVPAISYSTPQTYTAGVAIAALSPANVGGTVAAPGCGSVINTLGSGFNQPGGVAVDGKGNVYVADATNNLVKKIPAGNGTPVNIGGGFAFSDPTGIAIDSLGNVYVADEGNNTVEMITAASGLTATAPIGSGIAEPNAVAVDANGNVYVTDESTQAIYEILAGGAVTNTIATNFTQLTAIAVDAQGNVYAADGGANSVYKNPTGASGGISIGLGFIYPSGLAVDPLGIVYVVDQGDNALFKVLPNKYPGTSIIRTGFNNPGGIAVDGAGNIYIADTDNNAVEEVSPVGGYYVNRALPAGLCFDSTTGTITGTPNAGSTATDYTITAYNAGGGHLYRR
jgi:large repetitive protein